MLNCFRNVIYEVTFLFLISVFSVITNNKEVRYLKKLFKVTSTPVEEGMFNQGPNGNQSGAQIFLKPKETVFIPFKYQSFKTSHYVQPQVRKIMPVCSLLISSSHSTWESRLLNGSGVVTCLSHNFQGVVEHMHKIYAIIFYKVWICWMC